MICVFFSFAVFNILSLFCVFSVLTWTCCGGFLSCLVYLMFCVLLVSVWVCSSLVWQSFLLWSFKVWSVSLTWDSSPSSMQLEDLDFSLYPTLTVYPFPVFSMFFHIPCLFGQESPSPSLDILSSAWFTLLERLPFEFSSSVIIFSVPSSLLFGSLQCLCLFTGFQL